MPEPSTLQRFVILPPRGVTFSEAAGEFATQAAVQFLPGRPSSREARRASAALPPGVRVLGSIHEDGAKLIEAEADAVSALRAAQPGMRALPLCYYQPARAPRPLPLSMSKAGTSGADLQCVVLSSVDRKPVSGVQVVAFTDFQKRIGIEAKTDDQGAANLAFGSLQKKLDRLYLFPEHSFWPAWRDSFTLHSGDTLVLESLDPTYTDSLRHFYPSAQEDAGSGVSVAVIDTGLGPHANLTPAGGANFVFGEDPKDFADRDGHGTHVARIIASRGLAPRRCSRRDSLRFPCVRSWRCDEFPHRGGDRSRRKRRFSWNREVRSPQRQSRPHWIR